MALPDHMRLREVLKALDAKPRLIHDFTHATSSAKFQFTENAIESWLHSMRERGWVTRNRRMWQITNAGRAHLREMDGQGGGRFCAASTSDKLTGYGAYMARSEGRPGANDFRQYSRRGF